MKVLVAISMGFFSGFLVYMMAGMLFLDVRSGPGPNNRSCASDLCWRLGSLFLHSSP